jgi:hypothetical protein
VADGSDILDLLTADHDRLQDALSGDDDVDLIRDLTMHIYAEEDAFHPTLRHQVSHGGDLADDLLDVDHRLLEALAEAEEKGLSPRSAAVNELFARHRAAFEAAADPARTDVDADELARLGQVLLATLPEAPTHPHPHLHGMRSPLKPIVDATASTVDHLRDRFHEYEEERKQR